VWPAVFPGVLGGGTQLNPGTGGVRIWARTDCVFGGGERGSCKTEDCAGELRCKVSGKPPATLAEFTVGGGGAGSPDFYDVSVVDGSNVPLDFASSTGGAALRCRDPACADGSHPSAIKVRHCMGNSDYKVTFCDTSGD
jgi:hypothetical protein